MQLYTSVLSAFLIVFTAGCKNKQELPDAASKPAPVAPVPPTVATEVAAPQEEQAKGDSIFFSLERTPCFGSCPTYKVTILQDGSATYTGRRFAVREGIYTGHVDKATMASLAEAAGRYGFYAMDNKYDKPVTDLPSVIIRVHADKQDKQVIGRVGAPMAFKEFTKEAEKLIEGVEWTKQEETH